MNLKKRLRGEEILKFGSTGWPAYLKVFTITNYISQSNEKVTLQQKRANHIEANKTRKEALGFQTNQCNLEIGKSWSQTGREHFRKKRYTVFTKTWHSTQSGRVEIDKELSFIRVCLSFPTFNNQKQSWKEFFLLLVSDRVLLEEGLR